MRRLRKRPLALLLTSLLSASPAPAPAPTPTRTPPKRVVSLNMCADQLVIALADRSQIAGLTEWARDPELSFYADRAKNLPFTHRSAEEVLERRPDLVIGAPPGHGRSAAYYQRQGYLTGTGTLVDDMMHRVGLVNIAARLGRPELSQIPLEQLALARPDFVVTEEGTRAGEDRSGAMIRHPLLEAAVRPAHHLHIPQALTVCGGPGYPHAVALLADEIRHADRVTR